MEMYKHALNLDAQNIAYRGSASAVTDALGRQINMVMASVPSMSAFVKQG